MSSIDQYQLCVCGSGKKLKFCKCGANENSTELDRILRLIDGDQDLAALDRINGQLSKLPNAAWLLALKADLLLRLDEVKPLVEVAQRFLRLKPDNPMALFYRSIAAYLDREPIQDQAKYLLTAMAESRNEIPANFAFAVDALVERITHGHNPAFLGIWGLIQLGFEKIEKTSRAIQRPMVHLFCKVPNRLVEPPAGAPWLERLDEVRALEAANRFELVEKKTQSILRDYPNQAAPLSNLLRAQVAQLDESGALATALKLAEHTALSADERAYFRALAGEYDPATLRAKTVVRFVEIESDESVIEVLRENENTELVDSEYERYFASELIGEEVPAKHVYSLEHFQNIEGRKFKSHVGVIYLYGKQTDQPARVLISAFDYPLYRTTIDQVITQLGISKELEPPTAFRTSMALFFARPAEYIGSDPSWETPEEFDQRVVEEFLNLPLPYLDDHTPLEAVDQPQYGEKLRALALHLEGEPSLIVTSSVFDEIYRRLKIERPAPANEEASPESGGYHFLDDPVSLARFDWSKASDDKLIKGFNALITLNFGRAILEAAKEVLSRPPLAANPAIELLVRPYLVGLLTDPNEKVEHSLRVIDLLVDKKLPIGQAVMAHMRLLHQAGRSEEAERFFSTMIREYPDDPQLFAIMNQLYEQFQQQGAQQRHARPDVGGMNLSPSATADGGGSGNALVLPGQSSTSQSESKLWLPGS